MAGIEVRNLVDFSDLPEWNYGSGFLFVCKLAHCKQQQNCEKHCNFLVSHAMLKGDGNKNSNSLCLIKGLVSQDLSFWLL
jgi:hypothetical protein